MSPDSAGCVHSMFREHHLGIHLFRYAEEMHKGIEAVGAPLKQCTSRRNAGGGDGQEKCVPPYSRRHIHRNEDESAEWAPGMSALSLMMPYMD